MLFLVDSCIHARQWTDICNTRCSILSRFSHFHVLQFPPLQVGAANSCLAFSTPVTWCRIFMSRNFMSRIFSVPVNNATYRVGARLQRRLICEVCWKRLQKVAWPVTPTARWLRITYILRGVSDTLTTDNTHTWAVSSAMTSSGAPVHQRATLPRHRTPVIVRYTIFIDVISNYQSWYLSSSPTAASRPSNPLNPFLRAPQIRLCWPLCAFINHIYLLTYLLTY